MGHPKAAEQSIYVARGDEWRPEAFHHIKKPLEAEEDSWNRHVPKRANERKNRPLRRELREPPANPSPEPHPPVAPEPVIP